VSSDIQKLQQQIALLQRKLSREQLARTAAEDMLNNYSRDAYLANQNLRRALSETRAIYHQLLSQLPDSEADTFKQSAKPSSDSIAMVDRMTLLSQLAAGIAHEINNPIGFIKSNCEIQEYMLKDVFDAWDELKDELNKDSTSAATLPADMELKYLLRDVREMLSDMQKSSLEGANRIAEIVSSLQIFSSPVTVERNWEDVDDLLEFGLEDIIKRIPANVSLNFDASDSRLQVLVNRKQIRQVLEAVVENAIDACVSGGTISIAVADLPGAVKVFIKDNGEGIKPEHMPLIFTPFFTTRPPGSGTGLGLSVAQALMESHNGWIEIQSDTGSGTTVTLNFPLQ